MQNLRKKQPNSIILNDKEIKDFSLFWGKQGKTKTAAVLQAINSKPGITTDEVRILANCSNVPNMVHSINKKLMNKGFIITRVEPFGVANNEAFHHWFLIEAPIMKLPIRMAMNDPIN